MLVAALSVVACSRVGRREKSEPSGNAVDGGDHFVQWIVPKVHSPAPEPTTYDDAEFHSQTVSDAHLPARSGATHIGLFIAWAITRDLAADSSDTASDRAAVTGRTLTGTQFLMRNCDGKVIVPAAREMVPRPSSSGCRIVSSMLRLNSGSSSRNSTP